MTVHEFDIIKQFFEKDISSDQNIILGIGDDAAILTVPIDHELIISTDTLVSGVHFYHDTSAFDIGHHALAVNLSDLAAMGATPAWITLALTLPQADAAWLNEFSSGLFQLANQYHTKLIGGDTTRGPLAITIQAHGFVPKGQALRRDHAQPGDSIYVTNTLGDAGLALKQKKFHRSHPQNLIGEKLRGIANAAIDISDGLVSDLGHILEKSKVGASLNIDALPLSDTLRQTISHEEALELALSAGDDYELCFTVPQKNIAALTKALNNSSYTCIGTVTNSSQLDLHFQNGKKYVLKTKGFQHF